MDTDKISCIFIGFGLLYCLTFLGLSHYFDWVSTEARNAILPWMFFATLPGTGSIVLGLGIGLSEDNPYD